MDEFSFTQEDLAIRVGRARSTVANTLRLLDLHPAVQDALGGALITEGHARALGGLPPEAQAPAVTSVIADDLSVRQTEELVRRVREPRRDRVATQAVPDPDAERVEEDLRRSLGTKVRLTRTRRGGRIVIEYFGEEELARLYQRLVGGQS
jgi:ParB family chromosome partitioning protein